MQALFQSDAACSGLLHVFGAGDLLILRDAKSWEQLHFNTFPGPPLARKTTAVSSCTYMVGTHDIVLGSCATSASRKRKQATHHTGPRRRANKFKRQTSLLTMRLMDERLDDGRNAWQCAKAHIPTHSVCTDLMIRWQNPTAGTARGGTQVRTRTDIYVHYRANYYLGGVGFIDQNSGALFDVVYCLWCVWGVLVTVYVRWVCRVNDDRQALAVRRKGIILHRSCRNIRRGFITPVGTISIILLCRKLDYIVQ